jgi:FtsZ-interacting cell division protein YlmF
LNSAVNNLGTNDVRVFNPKTTNDCSEIILYLKRSPALIDLTSVKPLIKQRIIDVLVGGACALDMGVCLIDKNNLLIVKK